MNIMTLGVWMLALGYPALLWMWRRSLTAAARETQERLQVAEKQAETAFMEGTRSLAEEVAVLRVGIERAREEAGTERAKSERYFLKISDFERISISWQNLYQEQATGHGSAQQLMMQTIEDLARQLQAKGVRVRIPRVLHAVREEFLSTHEAPAREALAALDAAKAAIAAESPTAPVTAAEAAPNTA